MKTNQSILVINTGSTSTKLAIYLNKTCVETEEILHSREKLDQLNSVMDEIPERLKIVLDFLDHKGQKYLPLSGIVARGGFVGTVKPAGYCINKIMVDNLHNSKQEHASNLAACLAFEISNKYGAPAFIYDGVTSDEMPEVAHITGIPELPKISLAHMLNMRAACHKACEMLGLKYDKSTFVACHLGGGISLTLHHNGHVIDTCSDDEGPFAPERAGGFQVIRLLEYMERFDTLSEKIRFLRGGSGFVAHLGTNDVREIEKRIAFGDKKAELVYEAMAYQISKAIGSMASVVKNRVDAVIFTGGVARSPKMAGLIKSRVDYIAPFLVFPGENEMEALAFGAYRILVGEEKAREYP